MKPVRPHTQELQREFPQLASTEAIYLDSAATSLKPRVVIQAVNQHLSTSVASVHRGAHQLGLEVSARFEAARGVIARAIGAELPSEIVFTPNTSFALLLLADHWSAKRRRAYVTAFEHHSNLAPWQSRFDLRLLPCDEHGRLRLDSRELAEIDGDSIVSIAQASNVTGVVQPIRELGEICQRRGALLVVDGAQSFPHLPIDVAELGCDFFAMSPHKAFGPSGVGVLFGRRERWNELYPRWLGGGTLDKYALPSPDHTEARFAARALPHRYELGTPNIEGVLGAAVAAQFLMSLDREEMAREADRMYRLLARGLRESGRFEILGGLGDGPYINLLTLTMPGLDSEHLATLLSDRYGVYARSGFHCAHPLFASLEIKDGGVRLSWSVYNTFEECDRVLAIFRELARGGSS